MSVLWQQCTYLNVNQLADLTYHDWSIDLWPRRKLGGNSCWQIIQQLDGIVSLHIDQTTSQLGHRPIGQLLSQQTQPSVSTCNSLGFLVVVCLVFHILPLHIRHISSMDVFSNNFNFLFACGITHVFSGIKCFDVHPCYVFFHLWCLNPDLFDWLIDLTCIEHSNRGSLIRNSSSFGVQRWKT